MTSAPFTLDHLTDSEFEEYCYDLLKLMGYTNLDWRKGTGLGASPSDNGRDVVCDIQIRDIDKSTYTEHVFVQCKHYLKGVPPEKIYDALAWASAEKPQVLILIASNFFSNPTKNYIELYKKNHNPKFRIKLWERPNLEEYSQGHTWLLHKYKLADNLEFIEYMHPAHLEYIKTTHINSLDELFLLLDEFSDADKMNISGFEWETFLHPRYKQAMTGKESMNDLRIDPISYELFKKKCYEIEANKIIPGFLLTGFLINSFLQQLFNAGDKSSIYRYS